MFSTCTRNGFSTRIPSPVSLQRSWVVADSISTHHRQGTSPLQLHAMRLHEWAVNTLHSAALDPNCIDHDASTCEAEITGAATNAWNSLSVGAHVGIIIGIMKPLSLFTNLQHTHLYEQELEQEARCSFYWWLSSSSGAARDAAECDDDARDR